MKGFSLLNTREGTYKEAGAYKKELSLTGPARKKFSNGAGFTLLEVFVSVAILSIIGVSVLMVLNMGNMSWQTDMGLVNRQQQVRQAMHGMSRELRQCSSDNSNITINSTGARIDFLMSDDYGNYTYSISYYLDNNQIIREHPASTTRVLANYIDDLSFCCWHGSSCDTSCGDADGVEIKIEAERVIRQGELLFNLTERVKLRNE